MGVTCVEEPCARMCVEEEETDIVVGQSNDREDL